MAKNAMSRQIVDADDPLDKYRGLPSVSPVVAWVASKMTHAKPIQTTITFGRVFG